MMMMEAGVHEEMMISTVTPVAKPGCFIFCWMMTSDGAHKEAAIEEITTEPIVCFLDDNRRQQARGRQREKYPDRNNIFSFVHCVTGDGTQKGLQRQKETLQFCVGSAMGDQKKHEHKHTHVHCSRL